MKYQGPVWSDYNIRLISITILWLLEDTDMATNKDSLSSYLQSLNLSEKSAIALEKVEENYILDVAVQNKYVLKNSFDFDYFIKSWTLMYIVQI